MSLTTCPDCGFEHACHVHTVALSDEQLHARLQRAYQDGDRHAIEIERRRVYEYLKEQAEDVVRTRQSLMNPVTVTSLIVRLAGEILRGLHARPEKVNNPELWR